MSRYTDYHTPADEGRLAAKAENRETIRQMLKDWNHATPEQREAALKAAAKAAGR